MTLGVTGVSDIPHTVAEVAEEKETGCWGKKDWLLRKKNLAAEEKEDWLLR